ncbi:MAG: orotate phosphoribosyltransferase [Armatimonadetes bacterium]|nr:orotate phosphoribosyltransferase [Armatimonadota bacterium]
MVEDLGKLLEQSGAILRGHFLLTSGRHSDVYFEKFRILEQPQVLSALCRQVAEHFANEVFDAVAGPTTGGIIIAFEVARQMGLPAIYVETENGVKMLRRGKTLSPGTRVLVVDDVLTTGKSIEETIQAIRQAGGKVSATSALIDRAESPPDFGCVHFSAYKVDARSFAEQEVPEWLAKIPVTKPGTRASI